MKLERLRDRLSAAWNDVCSVELTEMIEHPACVPLHVLCNTSLLGKRTRNSFLPASGWHESITSYVLDVASYTIKMSVLKIF